ncbi:MAG: hypothetical protein EPN97_06950 [Alphaproteobacteria bacterium]|nr:MAG: hypothetical protein EPN97_06950 [Alphaproteobacteria bacterium]
MAYRDNTAPQSQATAREVALELGGFTQQLREASKKLEQEASNIRAAKAEIKEELDDTVKTFVKTTFTSLTDGKFDELSRTAQKVPELGTQSPSFYVKKLQLARDEGLKTINAQLDETIDADGFQKRYTQAKEQSQEAAQKGETARGLARQASQAIENWHKTGDYEFMQMDKRVAEAGKPALTSDNRAFYEPKGFFQKAWWYVSKGSEYRGVRKALKDYGHGLGGKDAFADLAGFKTKDTQLEKSKTDANASYEAAAAEQQKASSLIRLFSTVESQVKTDDQILSLAQDKVATYFSTPAFVTAIEGQYGEDFPASVPLMIAKMTTLDKLAEGVQEKIQIAHKNYTAAAEQYQKVSRIPAYKKVNVDMDDLQKRNRARIQEYDNYTTAANRSWNRTRTYSPSHTTVYVDRSPSFFELMLLNEMLNSNHHNQVYHQHHNTYAPDPMASYTTDLMKVDKSAAANLGIPTSVFDTSPEVARQMQDLGVSNYKTNDFLFDSAPGIKVGSNDNSRPAASADALFDTAITEAAATPAPSYSGNSDRGYSSSPSYRETYNETKKDTGLFDTAPSGRTESPSFGGTSFGSSRS